MKLKNSIIKNDLDLMIKRARSVAANNYQEICGILIHNGQFIEMIELKNQSRKSCQSEISEKQIKNIKVATKILNHQIVGTFHSHPLSDAKPGEQDLKGFKKETLMLIIDCIDKNVKLWRIKDGKKRELKLNIINV